MLNFLGVIIILWFYEKISLLLGDACKCIFKE